MTMDYGNDPLRQTTYPHTTIIVVTCEAVTCVPWVWISSKDPHAVHFRLQEAWFSDAWALPNCVQSCSLWWMHAKSVPADSFLADTFLLRTRQNLQYILNFGDCHYPWYIWLNNFVFYNATVSLFIFSASLFHPKLRSPNCAHIAAWGFCENISSSSSLPPDRRSRHKIGDTGSLITVTH